MQVTCRIKVETRYALMKHAARERRTLSNMTEILLEWSLTQLEKKGSTERLLRRKVPIPRNPDGKYKRKTIAEPRPEQGGKALG